MRVELKALADGLVAVIKDVVAAAESRLGARVKTLEERAAVPGPRGEVGEKGDPGESAAIIFGEGPPILEGRANSVYIDTKTWDVYRCA